MITCTINEKQLFELRCFNLDLKQINPPKKVWSSNKSPQTNKIKKQFFCPKTLIELKSSRFLTF